LFLIFDVFYKYLKTITQGDTGEVEKTLNELHKSFATLSQEEQKYANIFLHDIQNGDIQVDENKTFKEYIAQYQANAKNSQITALIQLLGLDDTKLQQMINSAVTETNLNDYGRFDALKESVDKEKAKEYFESLEGTVIPPFKINMKVHNLLKDFVLNGGYEL
jgi:type I restriction enzyme R subunit